MKQMNARFKEIKMNKELIIVLNTELDVYRDIKGFNDYTKDGFINIYKTNGKHKMYECEKCQYQTENEIDKWLNSFKRFITLDLPEPMNNHLFIKLDRRPYNTVEPIVWLNVNAIRKVITHFTIRPIITFDVGYDGYGIIEQSIGSRYINKKDYRKLCNNNIIDTFWTFGLNIPTYLIPHYLYSNAGCDITPIILSGAKKLYNERKI